MAAQVEGGAILACPSYAPYHYSWLRDGAFCAAALEVAGHAADAANFHRWVAGRVLAYESRIRSAIVAVAMGQERQAGDDLPCRFAPSGQAPTGDGWGAFQMDGPGLWLWSLERHARAAGGLAGLDVELRRAASVVAEYVTVLWSQPSFDAWEEHGEALATSSLAACLAGLLAAHRLGIEFDRTTAAVQGIRTSLATRGRRWGYLPRSDGDEDVDASLLWCGPTLGAFHRGDDGWLSTLERIESELVGPGGGVYRFGADTFYGGGQWPVLTAAYGLACLARGEPDDLDRARRSAEWIEDHRDAGGGLPEQVSDDALHPDHAHEWQARWGPVAMPLSWSHAMAVLLRQALAAEGADPSVAHLV